MSSPSPCNSKKNSNPFETPAVKKKKEDYEDYDLSPPKLRKKEQQRTFEDAVNAIKRDFCRELRLEWVDDEKVIWFKKRSDGTEADLPLEFRRILLFLYGRNFKRHVNQNTRRAEVREMLSTGRIRKVIRQVINCSGDNNLSSKEHYQTHYTRACLTIYRYFQQPGASGFSQDMSSLIYYLRMQKCGSSCFIQAACVAMSYLLQVFGEMAAPPDASRLIRHHFNDEQIIRYIVKDFGGDSVGIFKILEKTFFECSQPNREPDAINTGSLSNHNLHDAATNLLQSGPGLVSKFMVPQNFYCLPPSDAVRRKFPDLDAYVTRLEEEQKRKQDQKQNQEEEEDIWRKIPTNLIPPGVARFTTWDEPAEFILLDDPTDEVLLKQEAELKERWNVLLNRSTEDDDRSTAVTASISAESNYDRQLTLSERSTTDNASMFMDDDSVGQDWSDFGDDEDDDSSSASNESNEPEEGNNEASLHAMVLLGRHMDNESEYWAVQNFWEGPTQIMEFGTDYFMKSGAFLYFYDRAYRQPKPQDEWEINNLESFFCPSPIAESGGLERSDGENWPDDLIHSAPQQEQELELDNILDTLFD